MAIERTVRLRLGLDPGSVRSGLTATRGLIGRFASDTKRMIGGIAQGIGGLSDRVGGVSGIAGALGLAQATRDVITFDHGLNALGRTADLSAPRLAQVRAQLLGLSGIRETGQGPEELRQALALLVGAGQDLDEAAANLKVIGRAATASDSDMADMARTAFELADKFRLVKPEELARGLDILTAAGNAGAFELKDMASFLPTVAASFASLGVKGQSGLASAAASLQIAMKGTSDAGVAANNLQNFLNKITVEAPKLKSKLGVDIFAGTDEQGRKVLKDYDTILSELVTNSKGDITRLQGVFADAQVLAFLRPLVLNFEEYKKIREEALNSNGAVDKNFVTALGSAQNQLKGLRIEWQKFSAETLAGPLEDLTKFMSVLNEYPRLTRAAITAGLGMALALGAVSVGRQVVGGAKGLRDMVRGGGGAAGAAGTAAAGLGISRVFVVNWPVGLLGAGDSSDLGMFGGGGGKGGGAKVPGAKGGRLGKIGKAAGVAGLVLGGLAVASTLSDDGISGRDKAVGVGSTAGGLGGGWAGAAMGAAIGTAILPGVGSAVGAVIGGLGGSLLGSKVGESVAGALADWVMGPTAAAPEVNVGVTLVMNPDGTLASVGSDGASNVAVDARRWGT